MLIIEILLTIFAWRKGWRWFSLIPVATAFSIGLMFGFSQIEPGVNGIFIDILAMIALILMIIYPKKEQKKRHY
jgi:predicted exporter